MSVAPPVSTSKSGEVALQQEPVSLEEQFIGPLMKSCFSEFSYGFAVLHEFCRTLGTAVLTAPELPSLIEEGRGDGGHDARLDLPGKPLFLQFKCSEYMVLRSAREWKHFLAPYYRFWIHAPRESNQHALLVARDVSPNVVYYVAPEFHTSEDFNHHFISSQVLSHSIFFRPTMIPALPDNNAHSVAFLCGAVIGHRCSDDIAPAAAVRFSVLRQQIEDFSRSDEVVIEPDAFFSRVSDDLGNILAKGDRQSFETFIGANALQSVATRAGLLCRIVLGAELLWITEPRL